VGTGNEAATNCPWEKRTTITRLTEAAVMRGLLTYERKLYRLAFSESNVPRQYDTVIFRDESTFSSANDGPVLITDCGENVTAYSICPPLNAVVVCLFTAGTGYPTKELEFATKDEHLDCLRRHRILKKVMEVPCVTLLYPNTAIQFQYEHVTDD
jgi:hypothetical protein